MTADDPINRPLIGVSFEDHLFQYENQRREMACAWKIMRSPQYMQLAAGSWRLRAVAIPLWLAGGGLQGDIDLLLGTWTTTPNGASPTIYRSFELKTSKIARDSKVTSLKRRGFNRTVGQLKKLWDLGSPEVFLLDAFIIEAGYSRTWEGVPPEVSAEVRNRMAALEGSPQGYVALGLEQVEGYSERKAGVAWPVSFMKPTSQQAMGPAFRRIIAELEEYQSRVGGWNLRRVISYCYAHCRELTHVDAHGPYVCSHCGASLV